MARRDTVIAGMIAAVAVLVLGVSISWWITGSITRLTHYAMLVRDGKRVALPRLGGELKSLGVAFEEMRTALEGKRYVEQYVEALTHQMKSPLSAIQGAAELLKEDMPEEERVRFLENVRAESGRMQELVDRMLQLSALENRNTLRDVEAFDVTELVSELVESLTPVLSEKSVALCMDSASPIIINGEVFLIRQAVLNLVQNAVDFSDENAKICVSLEEKERFVEINIEDSGPGIPEYAIEKVFDRFYSLPRPDTGRKSSGLGLPFVQEVAALHGGRLAIANRSKGGIKATLTLSVDPRKSSI